MEYLLVEVRELDQFLLSVLRAEVCGSSRPIYYLMFHALERKTILSSITHVAQLKSYTIYEI